MELLVVTVGAAAATPAEAELDTTIPTPVVGPSATAQLNVSIPTAAPPVLAEAEPQSTIQVAQPPSGGTEARWLQEGAKPKEKTAVFACFTPNPNIRSSTPGHGPWIPVKNKNRRNKSSPRSPAPADSSEDILLTNRFSSLEEQDIPPFPPPLMQLRVSPPSLLKPHSYRQFLRRQSQCLRVTTESFPDRAAHRQPKYAPPARRDSKLPFHRWVAPSGSGLLLAGLGGLLNRVPMRSVPAALLFW